MPPRKRVKKEAAPLSPPHEVQSTPAVGDVPEGEKVPAEADNSASHVRTPDRPIAADIDVSHLDEADEVDISDGLESDAISKPSTKTGGGTRSGPGYGAAGGGYNALKSFNGQVYSGMAIGGSHTWNYDQGVWKETKEEPDLWKIEYETTKRRARNAPRGSGAPVGTEYHWLIVAHQHVKKVDANTYETRLVGSKYKLAHKLASSNSWSVPTVKAQREREIELLEDAKRRVQGLPPVLASEKVKVKADEKGQQKLDALFAKAKVKKGTETEMENGKRKREVEEGGEE
ncbi:hypothetical protein VTK56DRAFT_1489 [Thermocarpiscus australiensis]